MGFEPDGVYEPGDGGEIPDGLAAAGVVLHELFVDAEQVVANRAFALQMLAQFPAGSSEQFGDAESGYMDERGAAVKDDLRRLDVLDEVEVVKAGCVVGPAAKRDYGYALADARLQQQGGRHIGERAERQDVERAVAAASHSAVDDVGRGVAGDGIAAGGG